MILSFGGSAYTVAAAPLLPWWAIAALGGAAVLVLAQLCDVVDLDGPYGLADDPLAAQIYRDGEIFIPDALWGAA